jgi:hypothetical protein
MSRRRFLRRSGAAISLAAAPMIVPRSVLGRGAAQPGPNQRVLLGIIGCGERGQQLANNVPAGAQVAAVSDCDLRKARKLVDDHQAQWHVDQNYRRMIDRKEIDGVLVCATDHHHVLASILACQAGKDVYCEKPLSLYIREGRALVDAARKYDRVVQTGTQQTPKPTVYLTVPGIQVGNSRTSPEIAMLENAV